MARGKRGGTRPGRAQEIGVSRALCAVLQGMAGATGRQGRLLGPFDGLTEMIAEFPSWIAAARGTTQLAKGSGELAQQRVAKFQPETHELRRPR